MGSYEVAVLVGGAILGALIALAAGALRRQRGAARAARAARADVPADAAPAHAGDGHDAADSLAAEMTRQRTDLDARRERLEKTERTRNLLVSKMSHDLRTPLNSINTLSQLLVEGNAGPLGNEQRRYLEVIHRSGESLLALMNSILDLASLEAGRLEVDLGTVDIRAVLQDAAETARRHAEIKGLAFRATLPRRPLVIRTDEDRLRQVVGSLLDASLAATANGYVELSAAGDGGEVRIRITDTGPGFSAEARDLASEAALIHFLDRGGPLGPLGRRGASARGGSGGGGGNADRGGGSGNGGVAPGLAHILAGRLVSLMGGRISADSAPGEGTTFSLSFPEAASQPAYAPQPASREALRGRVLVIEDNDLERGRLADSLEKLGLEVTAVASGQHGLALLLGPEPPPGGPFDAVVLDLVMPGTTGLDVLRAAAGADDRLARTPFLVVSAMYMTRTERDVLGPRVAAVVRKGDTMMEELRSNLRRVLGDRTTTAEGDHPEPASAPPHRKARVLIVDDNADNLFSLREVLAPLPITIETASTGAEAIAACRQHPPDLIVMDVELPGPSGLETARAIRSLPDCANIPVIALTADAMPTDRERALADCNSYLAKPVQPKQVVSAVTRALHIQLH